MVQHFHSCDGTIMFSTINESTAMRRVKMTRSKRLANRRGAMLVLILVMLVGFFATVVFSVTIAHQHLARTEMRSATEAAAQAASLELAATSDTALAIQKGQEIAMMNRVNGQPLQLVADDFQFGRSDRDETGCFIFSAGATPPNTVRVNFDYRAAALETALE